LLAPAYIPTQIIKGPHFGARARHLFFMPDFGLKAKFTEGVKICATAEQQKMLWPGVVAGARFITTKIANTLNKTLV